MKRIKFLAAILAALLCALSLTACTPHPCKVCHGRSVVSGHVCPVCHGIR